MKKSLVIAFIAVLSISCKPKVEVTDIAKISGYWEIEKVVFPDGTTKEYGINEVYDYFEIKSNKGIRKKVMPQLDGTFLVNDAFEKIAIKENHEKYYINYSTSFSKWQEELISISNQEMVLVNDSKIEYHYKRAAPINLTGNGEKTK